MIYSYEKWNHLIKQLYKDSGKMYALFAKRQRHLNKVILLNATLFVRDNKFECLGTAVFIISNNYTHTHIHTYEFKCVFYTKTKLLNRANRDKQNKQLKIANHLDCQYKYLKKSPALWIGYGEEIGRNYIK